MDNNSRIMSMEAKEANGRAEIIVSMESLRPVGASYVLSVSGSSSTNHKGAATAVPGQKDIVSRVQIDSGAPWCATLDVEQNDGLSYRLTKGPC